jgi:hypothetical protein
MGFMGARRVCLGPDAHLYVTDWVPLEESYLKQRYASIAEFEAEISQLHEASSAYEHFQKEVHYPHPLVLGGYPKATPVMLDQDTHAKACCYFNRLCRHLKDKVAR